MVEGTPVGWSGRRHCALIVETDPDECWLLENGLIRCGAVYGTGTAGDEASALDMCRRCGYDLILINPAVPGDRGPALIRGLRQLEGERRIVLLASLPAQRDTVRLCCAAGADRVIQRPYSIRNLIRLVQELLGAPDLEALERLCRARLRERGFSCKLDGTRYLRRAAALLYADGLLPMKALYRQIAAEAHTAPENVEYAIRSAIQAAGQHGMTNKAFLYALTEELKRYADDE